jgi:hypothetical protein
MEIVPLGLRSICFEFGSFRTEFLSDEHRGDVKERIPDYKDVHENRIRHYSSLYLLHSFCADVTTQLTFVHIPELNGNQLGDPRKGVEVMLDFVRGEGVAASKPVPVVIGLGSDTYGIIKDTLQAKLQQLEEYKEVMFSTDLPKST